MWSEAKLSQPSGALIMLTRTLLTLVLATTTYASTTPQVEILSPVDGSIATIDALPGIVEAVSGRIEVLMDGGIRRGTDVIKALALGARAVCVGRPVLWGLAVDGQAGVEHVLGLLREELERAMALCGAPSVGAIGGDLVVR